MGLCLDLEILEGLERMLALPLLLLMPQLLLLLLPPPLVTSHLLLLNLPNWSWLSKLVFKLAEAWQGSAGSRWCMVRTIAMDCQIISAIFIYLFAIRNASFQLKELQIRTNVLDCFHISKLSSIRQLQYKL